MSEKHAVAARMAVRYRKASKGEKGRLLDELCELTGWSRDHARRALRWARGGRRPGRRRARAPVYGDDVIYALRRIWAILNFPCGKRLHAVLADTLAVLERHNEIVVTAEVRRALCSMSAATIDRRLAADRRRHRLKGRSGTKPGTLLRHQIPIRTFADWDDGRPGFCELDLVGHDGGVGRGEYCQTLVVTCVASGWTEPRAVRNKAHRWVFEALVGIRDRLPFPLLGIDSDNGSEFINKPLHTWCEAEQITFTRTRPYRKNDNCFVEQKNWSVVRVHVGYHRYDTQGELALLNDYYELLRLYVNHFQPSMKLISKTRDGAHVRRRYDTPQTPYQRLTSSPDVRLGAKTALRREHKQLNPAQLQRDMVGIQEKLLVSIRRKQAKRRKGEATKTRSGNRTSSVRQRTPLRGHS